MALKKIKIKKGQVSNIIWLLLIFILLFTPIGFHVRVQIGRLFSFTPSIESVSDTVTLEDYNWSIQGMDGHIVNLNNSKGDVILINFWATWCPPCIAEMPSLVDLYKSHGNKVKFVFVASDEEDKVRDYLDKTAYNIPVYFAVNQPPEAIATSSLPTTYIIDKDGKIIIKEVGAAKWNSEKITNLLDTLVQVVR